MSIFFFYYFLSQHILMLSYIVYIYKAVGFYLTLKLSFWKASRSCTCTPDWWKLLPGAKWKFPATLLTSKNPYMLHPSPSSSLILCRKPSLLHWTSMKNQKNPKHNQAQSFKVTIKKGLEKPSAQQNQDIINAQYIISVRRKKRAIITTKGSSIKIIKISKTWHNNRNLVSVPRTH